MAMVDSKADLKAKRALEKHVLEMANMMRPIKFSSCTIEVSEDREILVVFDKKTRDVMFKNVLVMQTSRSNFNSKIMFKTSWEKTVKRLCSMPDVEFWIFPENTRVLEGVCFEQLMVDEDLAGE